MQPSPHSTVRLAAALILAATLFPAPGVEAGAPQQLSDPAWAHAALGRAMGRAGILLGDGSDPELFLSGTSEDQAHYWYTLGASPTGGLETRFVSHQLPRRVVKMVFSELVQPGEKRLVVAMDSGEVRFYDPRSKAEVGSVSLAIGESLLQDFAICDCDGDGAGELLTVTGSRLRVFDTSGATLWSLAVDGSGLAVGQMDDDPALEIALTLGAIVDGATRSVEWVAPFSRRVAAVDLDGERPDELIMADRHGVRAYRVDLQAQVWELAATLDNLPALGFGDVDGDRVVEVIVHNQSADSVEAYDGVELTLDRQITDQWFSGGTAIALADLDGDGVPGLIWDVGATSSGPDFLFLDQGDWGTAEWRSADLRDGFLGPRRGDLDGDGRAELVVASRKSHASHGPKIVVFDGTTLAHLATSDPLESDGARDLEVADLDGDGRAEIVLAARDHSEGEIAVYRYSEKGFERLWTNVHKPSGVTFTSVEVADVDGDGAVEIVGGVDVISTGYEGPYLYAFDRVSGAETWRSELFPSGEVIDLAVSDSDGDAVPEVHALAADGSLHVFDGAGGAEEAVIEGDFTALRIASSDRETLIHLGTENGAIVTYRYAGGTYHPVGSRQLGTDAIDGFEIRGSSTWVGSGGRLRLFEGETQLWRSDRFGRVFGREILLPDAGHPGVYAAGSYSVNRFSLGAVPP